MGMEMLDAFGVPEYFCTDIGAVEDAGGGNIRVVRCIRRSGVLIPVYSLVTPALGMIVDSVRVREMAEAILNSAQLATAHH